MKYMGSKSAMLENGLGEMLAEESRRAARVIDLFTGSAAIAWYAAENTHAPVLAVDLQEYAVVLANAVISRTQPLDPVRLDHAWLRRADQSRRRTRRWKLAATPNRPSAKSVMRARELCSDFGGGPVWRAYGGYYFSPRQAETIDALIAFLPLRNPARTVCLASILHAASRCCASPGHTAQPFRPTSNALPFIADAWMHDPISVAAEALSRIAPKHGRRRGEARVRDAMKTVAEVRESDLVIIDPPYSAVQYSRFYHVLETIATQASFEPAGAGRYPPFADRPQSAFSLKTRAAKELEELFSRLAVTGCSAIVTFPVGESSNGLSGSCVGDLARTHFKVRATRITSRFSTLGGNHHHRPPRHRAEELILLLSPA
jgi:adenine-specific DNA-methyltransferase